MNIALWIVQTLLAVIFALSGFMKVSQPKEKLLERMGVLEEFSQATIRTIGTLEILGALGLILPAVTGILPWLTPLAAIGLVLTMIGAAIAHYRHDEYPNIAANFIILLLAVFVAYGRFVAVPL